MVRGYSLIGKTSILHIAISGSIPDFSIVMEGNSYFKLNLVPFFYSKSLSFFYYTTKNRLYNLYNYIKQSLKSSIGRARLWRCLGYKFESYFRHAYY